MSNEFESFFARAPRINPNASRITVTCGYRVEAVENKLMQQIRCLDKQAMDKILRK